MKDRIRQIMESQHMTQQVFADFIGLAPATLSSIYNERTRPTLGVVEAIRADTLVESERDCPGAL